MKVILIRHYKVNFKWKFIYNSCGFEKACAEYDCSDVIDCNLSVGANGTVISSTMIRALKTVQLIFHKQPDIVSNLLCEVPMKPFLKTNLFLPHFIWKFFGRLQWRINSEVQPESFLESRLRIDTFMDTIIDKGDDYIIIAHGWIIKFIISRLIRSGFHGPNPILIRNGFIYEFVNFSKKCK